MVIGYGSFRAKGGRLKHIYGPREDRTAFVVLGSLCGATQDTWRVVKAWADVYQDKQDPSEIENVTCKACLKLTGRAPVA